MKRVVRREPTVDILKRLITAQIDRESQTLPGAGLDALVTDRVGKHIPAIPSSHGKADPITVIAKPIAVKQRARKRLSGQVVGRPGKPARQPPVHLRHMSRIQLCESRWVRTLDKSGVTGLVPKSR